MLPKRISHYEIRQKIGDGGMGSVYLAWDVKLQREVVLKLLPPDFSQDPERIRRLIQEAMAASSLSHPNIIVIYEFGAYRGKHFIVMEYVQGISLRSRLDKGALTLLETVRIGKQIAAALNLAHAHSIIHRDIKPENIMLPDEGPVKVIDWGVAKVIVNPQTPANSGAATLMKSTGPVGTARYMSPEQLKEANIDGRTDIWNLGILLYEMATGKSLFPCSTGEAIHRILSPDAIEWDDSLPEKLDLIVRKALQKEAKTRYATAAEALLDLSEIEDDLIFPLRSSSDAVTDHVPTRKPRPWRLRELLHSGLPPAAWAMIIVTVVALAFGSGFFYLRYLQRLTQEEVTALIADGREHWKERTGENLSIAEGDFKKAIAMDPSSAEANLGLADTYVNMEEYLGAPTLETIPLAERYAEEALRLNTESSEIYATLAYICTKKWDWERAETYFKEAIRLNPKNTKARHWYSLFLRIRGRYQDALIESNVGNDNDPKSSLMRVNVVINYIAENDLPSALKEGEDLHVLDPDFWGGRVWLGMVRLLQGDTQKGISDMATGVEHSQSSHTLVANLGYAYGVSHEIEKAQNTLDDLMRRQGVGTATGQDIAKVYAGLGETDKVFEWLEKDYEIRSGDLPHMGWHPAFKALRSDPRFVSLMKRMGL